MIVNDTSDLLKAILAVCPHVNCLVTDPVTHEFQDILYSDEATDSDKAAAQAVIDGWRDPVPVPSCDCKRLVQAMEVAGTLTAFATAYEAAKVTDRHRWMKYGTVPQDNPVYLRICAAAVPPIDPAATMAAALLMP